MLARPALTVKPTSIMTTMVLLFVSASSTIVLATAVSATSDVEGGINSSSSNPGSSSPSSSLTSSEGAAEVGGGSAMTMGGLERGTSGMFFVVHPRDHILGKSEQSVKVECTAFGANKITIRCGKDAFLPDRATPPFSDTMKELSASAELDRKSIERTHGKGVECFCEADNSTHRVKSDTSLIRLAYLKKSWREEPHPIQRVRVGNSAEICAQVPEGLPEPEVSWSKDGKPMDLTNQEGVLMTRRPNNRHCLIFSLVMEQTAGLYTCEAANIATNRTSLPSQLSVYLDGGWSEWSDWSECNVTCGLGSSTRDRHCTQPAPVNDGLFCQGVALEQKQCTRLCKQDGGWSEWSEWNACNTQCVHHRTRKCNSPSPRNGGRDCRGDTIDHANCTGGHCNQNYVNTKMRKDYINSGSSNPYGLANGGVNNNRRPSGTGFDSAGDGGGSEEREDDMFLYTLAMVTALLLFLAVMASAVFLCVKKYKYICRITGTGGPTSSSHHSHPHYPHTLAMEQAHHQSRAALSYSPNGIYVTKHHNGNVVTRLMSSMAVSSSANPAPPDVTQHQTHHNQQAIQILSDGTFYKTMFLEPPSSMCSGGSPAAVSSSGGYRPLPPTDTVSDVISSSGGYPPNNNVSGNKRGSPTRCNSAGLYSKTDTAMTLLSDQSSVANFCKQQQQPSSDMQMVRSSPSEFPLVYTSSGGSSHMHPHVLPNGSRLSDVTLVSRMYENTASHYQSIKDIESDATTGTGHYMSTPFCNQSVQPHPADNQVSRSSVLGKTLPGYPDKNANMGGIIDTFRNHRGAFPGISSVIGMNPNQRNWTEESDYFSQCSSEGGCGGGGVGVGGGMEEENGLGAGGTYHFDLCRNTVGAVDSCRTCNDSSSAAVSNNRLSRNAVYCSSS
ncbi:uncharacterized protein LOC134853827 isoform X2 [Symsagittifera roscoffensis]|uniref:uncharacterized protein LOC134853827 isoform X2 n=1 Tax=Symsagittifera roscoffensis TaxID=84072 RepID=UPI00307C9132